jgi:hypothetical protein
MDPELRLLLSHIENTWEQRKTATVRELVERPMYEQLKNDPSFVAHLDRSLTTRLYKEARDQGYLPIKISAPRWIELDYFQVQRHIDALTIPAVGHG